MIFGSTVRAEDQAAAPLKVGRKLSPLEECSEGNAILARTLTFGNPSIS